MNQQHLGIGMTSQRTRQRMVQRLLDQGIRSEPVLEVFRQVPRHIFVDEALASRAYEDTALPIGNSQTISQPYIVARMTELLMANSPQKVLEIGTGCGYQTAILAGLVRAVFSIERVEPLYQKARQHLSELRIGNAFLRHGDGYLGWPSDSPFDAILVAAAPPGIPNVLLEQLRDGGCLIIPVGDDKQQYLMQVTRQGNQFHQEVIEPVTFVPMLQGAMRYRRGV